MTLVQEIQERLKGKNISDVARRAGMAYPTVYEIHNGKKQSIRTSTYHKLTEILNEVDAESGE